MTHDILIDSMTDPPRFLVDRMLGRLVKWLRILGYDTAYLPQLSPQGLIREGRHQNRIILTRDTRVVRHKNLPPFVFVRADRFREQLRQVVEVCQLDPTRFLLTRCAECNEVLANIVKEKVRDHVPPYVWDTQSEFHQCPGCHRVYWGATHREHVIVELQRMGLCAESS
jgi:uncharacterized protein with PIN domain